METKRKILLVSRHGVKRGGNGDDKDFLTNESIKSLYDEGYKILSQFIGDNDVHSKNIKVSHSDKIRTVNTAKAMLAGANTSPAPKTREDLVKINFHNTKFIEDTRLGYEGLKFNMDAIKAEGADTYLKTWMSKPNSTEYAGQSVTSFNEVVQRCRPCLSEALENLITNGSANPRMLEMLSTHAGNSDALLTASLMKGRIQDQYSLNTFGGPFEMEDSFTMTLDESKGGIYTAKLSRNGKDYNLDLNNLIK